MRRDSPGESAKGRLGECQRGRASLPRIPPEHSSYKFNLPRRMRVMWLLQCEVTREKAATIIGVGVRRATVQRWVAAYRAVA